ncbi:MAG: GTP-binding protein [Rhodanobacteraceae bacterium]|nr:GTP-binding protein [Rhodanobacteraceae bacterium]
MSDFARKVCMLGDFGVGKTSLVARYVRNTFSDKYLTTVGVKVDSRSVALSDEVNLKLVIWDIAGKAALDSVNKNYLRGASGLILVADGTREPSLRAALDLALQAREVVASPACVLFVNKLDMVDRWEVAPAVLGEIRRSLAVFETSALSGDGVEAGFIELARKLAP